MAPLLHLVLLFGALMPLEARLQYPVVPRRQLQTELATEITNNSQDGPPSFRARLTPFATLLSITPEALTPSEVSQVQTYVENVCATVIAVQPEVVDASLQVDYVLLSSVLPEFDKRTYSSMLIFGPGVVKLVGGPASSLDASLVQGWMKECVNDHLLPILTGDQSSMVSYVSSVVYMPMEDDATVDGSGGGLKAVGPPSSNEGDDGISPGLVAGVVVAGALAMVIASALFVTRHRKSKTSPMRLDDDSDVEAAPVQKTMPSPSKTIEEVNSTMESIAMEDIDGLSPIPEEQSLVSEYTMATEPGDALALKDSLQLQPSQSTLSAESFVKARPMSLEKEMLTTPWSGRPSTGRGPVMETVLEPSHFSASEERRMTYVSHDGEDNEPDVHYNTQDEALVEAVNSIQEEAASAGVPATLPATRRLPTRQKKAPGKVEASVEVKRAVGKMSSNSLDVDSLVSPSNIQGRSSSYSSP